jgi:pseudouridine-5'-phosphate glycosidase
MTCKVALESAVITHGLPRPTNLEVARECEAAVREAGAEPASIAVVGGKVRVGLSDDELAALAEDTAARKCAVQDIGMIVVRGERGGTTVSAMLAISAGAGIAVASTGGIGGVHYGSFDVSADLLQLTRSAVTLVCAGAKSILNLPGTLEVLETLGVPVIGYGTDEFPGFFYADTGLPLRHRLDTPAEVAAAVAAYRSAGYGGAILVAQPPEDPLSREYIEKALEKAAEAAEEEGATGQEITPFLLKQLAEITDGQTLAVNRKLLRANAALAAKIALAIGQ